MANQYSYDLPANFLEFGEDSYATSFVLWYRPTDKLTLTGDANYFTNHINQNIALADEGNALGNPVGSNIPTLQNWNYGGTAVVLGFNANYAVDNKLKLTAGYEISNGMNRINPNGINLTSPATRCR